MTPVRVAAIQLCSSNAVDANLSVIREQLLRAADDGVQLAVLPENCAAFGPDATRALAPQHMQLRQRFSAMAKEAGIWLLAGTLPLPVREDGDLVPDGRVRSAALLFDAEGREVGRHDKRHLFDVEVGDAQGSYRESATFEPGTRLAVLDTPWGGLGVLTCYEIRFPEQAQRLRQSGAELLVAPSAFTALTGAAHWQVLLRARAIETQCLVIGAGQGGVHSPERSTWGHSQVIDAWGTVLAEQQAMGAGVVAADWDREAQADWRKRMPVLQHRRD